jgi:hypothetical protein
MSEGLVAGCWKRGARKFYPDGRFFVCVGLPSIFRGTLTGNSA